MASTAARTDGRPDPTLDAIVEAVLACVKPTRIILFGSRARGDAHADSDYDVLVEADGDRDAIRRAIYEALQAARIHAVELHVCSLSTLQRLRDDVGFIYYDVYREGRILYAAPDTGPLSGAPQVREAPSGPPESLRGWVERAARDFRLMEHAMAIVGEAPDGVCLHAHQSAEKFLKCVLIATNTRPPRTHALRTLLSACPPTMRDRDDLARACHTLQQTWPKARYPEDTQGRPLAIPTVAEALAAVDCARMIRHVVLAALGEHHDRSGPASTS